MMDDIGPVMFLYNYKTQTDDALTEMPENLSDYLPQKVEYQRAFELHQVLGKTPEEAYKAVLDTACGKGE